MSPRAFRTVGPRQVIVAAVVLAASALAVALLEAGSALLRPGWWAPVAALAGLAVVAELGGVEYRRHGSRIMLDHVPILAAIMAVGPAGTGLVALSGPLGFGLYSRRPVRRTVFNVAQISLSAVLAAGVYVLLGGSVGRGAELSFAPDLLAYLAGTTTFFAVNTVAYATIISVTGQDGWWLSWKKVRDELNVVFDLGVGLLTFLVAYLYPDWGILALGLLAVPLVGAHVFTTVQTHLHEVLWDLVSMLVTLLEKQDPYTSGHSVRVARRCREIAEVMDLDASEVEVVEYAALLHDIGKLEMIFQGVLTKDGPLTEDQRKLIEQHPIRGQELEGKAGEQFDPEVVERALQLGVHTREAGGAGRGEDVPPPPEPDERRAAASG